MAHLTLSDLGQLGDPAVLAAILDPGDPQPEVPEHLLTARGAMLQPRIVEVPVGHHVHRVTVWRYSNRPVRLMSDAEFELLCAYRSGEIVPEVVR